MDDAFEHQQSRAYLLCDALGDPGTSYEEADLAMQALDGLAWQLAGIRWPNARYAELYEEVATLRLAALHRMTQLA